MAGEALSLIVPWQSQHDHRVVSVSNQRTCPTVAGNKRARTPYHFNVFDRERAGVLPHCIKTVCTQGQCARVLTGQRPTIIRARRR